jgi:hypothetical protein
MKREVWFRYRPGLLTFGWPVHWKGWVLSLLLVAAGAGVFFLDKSLGEGLEPAVRSAVFWGGVVLAGLVFAAAAWPHRGYPPD